ncbi:hypothetical protein KEJ39_00065 [Candidatus Bathyarchaeota archaeon]|nr:hypothetical protein [Candidatus Bathyarchaeota archaeon]
MNPRFIIGSIMLLLGFTIYQIGEATSLKDEQLIRNAMEAALSLLPACSGTLSNSLLTRILGGIVIFVGVMLCASSLAKTTDQPLV